MANRKGMWAMLEDRRLLLKALAGVPLTLAGMPVARASSSDTGSTSALASYVVSKDESGLTVGLNTQTGAVIRDEDSWVVIQSAINELTEGGTVWIKRGAYLLSKGLSSLSRGNFTLAGEGIDATVLKLADMAPTDASSVFWVDAYRDLANITIKDMTIDGNWQNQVESPIEHMNCGIAFINRPQHKLTDCLVERVKVVNAGRYGIYPYDSSIEAEKVQRIVSRNVIIDEMGQYFDLFIGTTGWLHDRGKDCYLLDSFVRAPRQCAVTWGDAEHAVISGNRFETLEAQYAVGVSLGAYKAIITNNLIKRSKKGGVGVRLEQAKDCAIYGNIIQDFDVGILEISEGPGGVASNNMTGPNVFVGVNHETRRVSRLVS